MKWSVAAALAVGVVACGGDPDAAVEKAERELLEARQALRRAQSDSAAKPAARAEIEMAEGELVRYAAALEKTIDKQAKRAARPDLLESERGPAEGYLAKLKRDREEKLATVRKLLEEGTVESVKSARQVMQIHRMMFTEFWEAEEGP